MDVQRGQQHIASMRWGGSWAEVRHRRWLGGQCIPKGAAITADRFPIYLVSLLCLVCFLTVYCTYIYHRACCLLPLHFSCCGSLSLTSKANLLSFIPVFSLPRLRSDQDSGFVLLGTTVCVLVSPLSLVLVQMFKNKINLCIKDHKLLRASTAGTSVSSSSSSSSSASPSPTTATSIRIHNQPDAALLSDPNALSHSAASRASSSSPFSIASTLTCCGPLDAVAVGGADKHTHTDDNKGEVNHKGSLKPEPTNLDFCVKEKSNMKGSADLELETMMISPDLVASDTQTLAGDLDADVDMAMATDLEQNALELDGLDVDVEANDGLLSLSIPCGGPDRGRSSSPPVSTSSLLSSSSIASSAASSSASSVHSSFSATQKPPSTVVTAGLTSSINVASQSAALSSTAPVPVLRHLPKRTRVPSPRAAGDPPALRPLGPAHLEHDYTRARHELSAAVAIAAYDLYQFALPLRDAASEARRPSALDIPRLRAHPAVQKAATAVDRADRALEEALRRGETWENAEVPACWRWGSGDEKLEACMEWAYLEPEIRPAKRRRGRKTRAEVEVEMKARELGLSVEEDEGSVVRTRGQKRRAETQEEEDVVQMEDENDEGDDEASADERDVKPRSASVSLAKPRGRPQFSRNVSTASAPAHVFAPSSTTSVAGVVQVKRPRGRPRKYPRPETNAGPRPSSQKTSTSSTASPSGMTIRLKPSASTLSQLLKKASGDVKSTSITAGTMSATIPASADDPARPPPKAETEPRVQTPSHTASPTFSPSPNVPLKRPRGRPRKYALPGTVLVNGFCVPIPSLSLPHASASASADNEEEKSPTLGGEARPKEREREEVLRERRERESENSNARRSKRAKMDVSYRE